MHCSSGPVSTSGECALRPAETVSVSQDKAHELFVHRSITHSTESVRACVLPVYLDRVYFWHDRGYWVKLWGDRSIYGVLVCGPSPPRQASVCHEIVLLCVWMVQVVAR